MRLELLLVSAGGLYLELVLIRLLASEIRVFAYFKNFPLLAAFIGLGLGCYVADRRPVRLWLSAGLSFLLSLSAVFSERLQLSNLFFPDPALYIFRGSILSPNLVALAKGYPVLGHLQGHVSDGALLLLIGLASFAVIGALFAATALVFYPVGQLTGALFGGVRPLQAYAVNVAGALAGSLAFTLVSWLELGPVTWVVPPLLLLGWFAWRRGEPASLAASGAAALALLALLPAVSRGGERLVWSPYYRISLQPGVPETAGVQGGDALGWTLRVNHDYFQRAVDLRAAARAAAPLLARVGESYDLPYQLLGATGRVLVVGSGMGNDVAAALRAGAREVTAVDIDPAIIRLGKELHPERPLAAPQTTAVVDDARAFFHRRASQPGAAPFDLVVFGLLDSQTALSSMSSVRLEFFVYTVESMREALSLLDREHGLAVVTFSVGWRTWVGARIFRSIAQAAGSEPLALAFKDYDGGVSFVAGPGLARLDRARLAALGAVDVSDTYRSLAVRPCTDDWPFLYVNPDHWPWVYLVALALLLGIGSLLVTRAMRRVAPADAKDGPRFDLHMFAMGAAFMLVETGAIARLSLVFGATWVVNAAVISAVLLMVLASNAVVAAGKAPSLRACYALLFLSLALIWLTPFETFGSTAGGWALASLLVALPVLFSGLIFSRAFAEAPSAHLALGSNMLGSLAGGALEAASLATGIRSLALVALAVYAVSAVLLAWQRRRTGRAVA